MGIVLLHQRVVAGDAVEGVKIQIEGILRVVKEGMDFRRVVYALRGIDCMAHLGVLAAEDLVVGQDVPHIGIVPSPSEGRAGLLLEGGIAVGGHRNAGGFFNERPVAVCRVLGARDLIGHLQVKSGPTACVGHDFIPPFA